MGRAVDVLGTLVISGFKKDAFLGNAVAMARLDATFMVENALAQQCVEVAAKRAVMVDLDTFMISIL